MKILLLAASVALLAACNSSTSTDASKTADTTAAVKTDTASSADTWITLFDGKTTNGWHTYGQPKAGEAWKVTDGAITLDTAKKAGWQVKGGGDLVTDQEFENYDLKLEWKIAKNGNSGIIINIKEDTTKYKQTWMTGPEMQVLDNNGHPDAKIIKHRAGDLYDLISSSKETVKPANEWNEVEIMSNKGKLDLFLNGTNIVSTTMWDDGWKKLIAGSKFADMKDFGTFHSGKIALQDHGNGVSFRNIRIRKL